MNPEDVARRAAELALTQVADRAHALAGAAGARPGLHDGTRERPAGVALVPPRTDPADPAVFTARCGEHVCGGRFDQTAGGIAGGRLARRTDIDLLVYLAELAALPTSDWSPFFEFFSPRRLDDEAGQPTGRIAWGEDCRGRRHFDAAGLVNWCLEEAVDGRTAMASDGPAWAAGVPGAVEVAVAAPPRAGDVVVADRPGRDPDLGLLVEDGAGGGVVTAGATTAGVVVLPFSPTAWTLRRRPTARLLGV